jgi:hypothetical protein
MFIMRRFCLSYMPELVMNIDGLKTAWPLHVPTRERPAAIRLFFDFSSVGVCSGPPSGQYCRLRRHPASRRRIDAPPVEGLHVRRSVSCLA